MTNDVKGDLAAAFSVTHQKQGQEYVTGEQVTSRLNDVLGWDGWSFRIIQHGYNDDADEVWVLAEFIAGGTIKQQFGSQKHNRYSKGDNAGKIIDYGFDLKGAATDALKKCATLVGVGLYLQEKTGTPAQQRPAQAKPQATKPTFMQYAASLGHTADEVLAVAEALYESKDPNRLTAEQKQRVLVGIEDRKKVKKEAAA